MRRYLHLIILGVLWTASCGCVVAQDWLQFHVGYDEHGWAFPYKLDHFGEFYFEDDQSVLRANLLGEDGVSIPFVVEEGGKSSAYSAMLDSVKFSNTLSDWGRDQHKCFAIYVTVDSEDDVTSKEEYVHCYVSVDGRGEYPDLSGPARIRGRGNSTWEWYDKKPYRIKFDNSTKMLGIKKNKDWVLLANYRDVTKMMNAYCLLTAKMMGLPYTSPVRFAELFLNGEYKGIYEVAEQVEVGGNRVDIDEEEGVLLTFDVDDGPDSSPDSGDNFWSEVYKMPTAVKSPKNVSSDRLDSIRQGLAVLETTIKNHDYDALDSLMDISSYIAMIQLQEYVYNVELSAPRSIFMFRDKGGKWTMGPAWDWDAGFCFSWSDMYTGHTYFSHYDRSLLGTDPYHRNGEYQVPKFFTDMFCNARFVERYREQWASYCDSLYLKPWAETQLFIDGLNEAQGNSSPWIREQERWPISGFAPDEEIAKMQSWLQNRLAFLNGRIAQFPDSVQTVSGDYQLVGTLTKDCTLDFSRGYTQNVTIQVDVAELATLLGVESSSLSTSNLTLVPIDADGTEGENTAAKTYGAWFDADGNTVSYAGDSHVFIESDDLWNWDCGCHPSNCQRGDAHTVSMQYRYVSDTGQGLSVNVQVNFTVQGKGGGWSW